MPEGDLSPTLQSFELSLLFGFEFETLALVQDGQPKTFDKSGLSWCAFCFRELSGTFFVFFGTALIEIDSFVEL